MGTSMSERKKHYVVFLNISSLILSVTCVSLFLGFHGKEPLSSSSSSLILKHLSNKIIDSPTAITEQSCKALSGFGGNEGKCSYLKSRNSGEPCVSQGYIDYLHLFYCELGEYPIIGYAALTLWLLILFYLLGNTASEYFCVSLERISKHFDLSPTIAGVTLLSLGNGAPDVFSSLASFAGDGGGDGGAIGLNTVVGGASVISCVVVGLIAVVVRKRKVKVDKAHFVRDVFFFLSVLLCLTVVLIQKEIDLWGAISFFSIYIVYVVVVYVIHVRRSKLDGDDFSETTPLLITTVEKPESSEETKEDKKSLIWRVILTSIEMPLYLPRRLTIPVINEENWSRFYAVASATLAPFLVAALVGRHAVWAAAIIGPVLGIAAWATTENSNPPGKFTLPWLAAGFIMSVVWSYIIAQELVGLLVSLAYVFGVKPSILGLTVLAWGNSIGDLVTNLTMAVNGGHEGAQIAFSGCYAGPIFNTLFGLGLSLIGYCWSEYPAPVTISRDPHVFNTLGFLAGALFWALLVLPRRGMRLDGVFGGGLLVIYIVSLSLSLYQAHNDHNS